MSSLSDSNELGYKLQVLQDTLGKLSVDSSPSWSELKLAVQLLLLYGESVCMRVCGKSCSSGRGPLCVGTHWLRFHYSLSEK